MNYQRKTAPVKVGEDVYLSLYSPTTITFCEVSEHAGAPDGSRWITPVAQRPRDRSKYMPHQGLRERARRLGVDYPSREDI